jgi:hypothetical protein
MIEEVNQLNDMQGTYMYADKLRSDAKKFKTMRRTKCVL